MCRIRIKLKTALKGTEFYGKTYIVGGFVRDLLQKKQSNDIDLVVELKDGGLKLADYLYRKGYTSRPVVFKRFGTAFSMMGNFKLEFVMTRKESYNVNNRKPDVNFGTLKEDALRRDFTINTLLMKISSGEILDLTGKGITDIEKKQIKATSDPDKLFSEDPLRIMRAIRFSVELDFTIEEKTFEFLLSNSAKLQQISWERKRDEFSKILLSKFPARGMKLLNESGIMEEVLPEILPMIGLKQNKYHIHDVYYHTLEVLDKTPAEIHLRLAALLHDIGKPECTTYSKDGVHFYKHESVGAEISGRILKRFKFPLKTQKLVKKMILNHMKLKNIGEKSEKISNKTIRKLILDWPHDLELYLDLVHSDNICHAPEYVLKQQIPNLKRRINGIRKELTKQNSPVRGIDIINYFNIKPGKSVGDLQYKAREIWLEHPEWDKIKILDQINFMEEIMENKENKITEAVKEGVIKAYDLGEDVVQAIGKITKEIISTAKEEELSTKEKVQKLAQEALEGAKQGVKKAQPPTEEFLKKAGKSIIEAIKVAAPKVSHFAQDAFKGVYEGAKDVYDHKKEEKEK